MASRRKRVEFVLSMPRVGSWNGRWSGAGKHYAIVRELTPEQVAALGIEQDYRGWGYCWDDNWSARVTARVVPKGERLRKSDGFCGYEWMVDSILRIGRVEASEVRP